MFFAEACVPSSWNSYRMHVRQYDAASLRSSEYDNVPNVVQSQIARKGFMVNDDDELSYDSESNKGVERITDVDLLYIKLRAKCGLPIVTAKSIMNDFIELSNARSRCTLFWSSIRSYKVVSIAK